MKHYTVGLIFNSTLEKVVLALKNRPTWQVGKLNGIGGRIEEGETPLRCMVREAKEEADLMTREEDWTHFATLAGPDWRVDFFALTHKGSKDDVTTATDEVVGWYTVNPLPDNAITNIRWLVPMAIEKLQDDSFAPVTVNYA